jgi:hypothetical protein
MPGRRTGDPAKCGAPGETRAPDGRPAWTLLETLAAYCHRVMELLARIEQLADDVPGQI